MATLSDLAEEYKAQADLIKEQIEKLECDYDFSSLNMLLNTAEGRKYTTLKEIYKDSMHTYHHLSDYYK